MDTLTVRVGETALRTEHERLLRDALQRSEGLSNTAPRIVGDYSDEALDIARRTWRARMVHEHQSAAVFSRLLPQLMEAQAGLELKTTVLRMSMDELHHASLCASVVEALGGTARAETPLATEPLPEHADCPPDERLLRNALFVGCLSETVALALLTEEREGTEEPYIQTVEDQLRADEVLHAKLGWAVLGSVWPALDAAGRERTQRFLRVAFGELDERMHEALPVGPERSGEVREEMRALGLIDGRQARELFHDTVQEVLLPQLEAYGLAARQAWDARGAG